MYNDINENLKSKERNPVLNSFLKTIQRGCLLWLGWEAVPQFCTSIRKTSLAICWPFHWQPKVGPRITKAIWWALWIAVEKVTEVLWSQLIQGLEDHCLRFTSNQFANGLPSQPFNKRSAWGVKVAICNDPSSTVLKFLQLTNFSQTGAAPNRTTVSKVRLNNAPVERLQSFFRYKRLGMFQKTNCPGDLGRNCFDLFFPIQRAINLHTKVFRLFDYFKLIIAYFQCQFSFDSISVHFLLLVWNAV